MLLEARRLLERVTPWFLRSGLALDLRERVAQFAPGIATLDARLGEILPEREAAALEAHTAELVKEGAPTALAARVARLDHLVAAVDVIRLAEAAGRDLVEVGRIYFAVGARFALDSLRGAAGKLRPETAWQKMAVGALLDDFFEHQTILTRQVIGNGALDGWAAEHEAEIAPVEALLQEIAAAPSRDLAMLTVANRQLRALAGR
jgi:glutamate dehydrogenase